MNEYAKQVCDLDKGLKHAYWYEKFYVTFSVLSVAVHTVNKENILNSSEFKLMKKHGLNHMEKYCLETLGYIKPATKTLQSADIRHCGICKMYGHLSQECHKFMKM